MPRSDIPDIGEIAPDFTTITSDNTRFNLHESVRKSPYTVLVFYRGHW